MTHRRPGEERGNQPEPSPRGPWEVPWTPTRSDQTGSGAQVSEDFRVGLGVQVFFGKAFGTAITQRLSPGDAGWGNRSSASSGPPWAGQPASTASANAYRLRAQSQSAVRPRRGGNQWIRRATRNRESVCRPNRSDRCRRERQAPAKLLDAPMPVRARGVAKSGQFYEHSTPRDGNPKAPAAPRTHACGHGAQLPHSVAPT